MTYPTFSLRKTPDAQRGAALIVSLILLVVVTLMGLSGMQNTALQERMSGNMYDRSIAMQAAEAALSAADEALRADHEAFSVDCREDPQDIPNCSVVPPLAFSGTDSNWTDVAAALQVNTQLSAGDPQYHIQMIYEGQEPNGSDQTAGFSDAALQYGSGLSNAAPRDVRIYRITARSQAPDTTTNRAIVVLQTVVRRTI